MSNEISTEVKQPNSMSVFNNIGALEDAQRIAKPLSTSDLVPVAYRNSLPNCMIALETAWNMGESVLTIMQNSSVIHGKLGFDSKFIIARINNSGKFKEDLDFQYEGEGETRSCYAYTTRQNGKIAEGTKITWTMAVAEGWVNKSGSKWKTMPDLMLAYRAAAFFARVYCPQILMGLQSQDELIDIGQEPITKTSTITNLNSKVDPTLNNPEFAEYEEVTETEPDNAAAAEIETEFEEVKPDQDPEQTKQEDEDDDF